MWPPIRKFQTGGRSRKFPADNAERMQIAFALFANIVHIICKYVLHFIQFWTGQGLGQVVRIGPVRLSSGLICAPGWAQRIKTGQIWAPSPILSIGFDTVSPWPDLMAFFDGKKLQNM